MAKLSAHGKMIGELLYLTYKKAYFEDGTILKNSGNGWKVYGKVKPEYTPEDAYNLGKKKQEAFLAKHPAYAEYKSTLHDAVGFKNAWKLHTAIELMYDDPDGVWSDAGDSLGLSFSEVHALCKLYSRAMKEMQDKKSASI